MESYGSSQGKMYLVTLMIGQTEFMCLVNLSQKEVDLLANYVGKYQEEVYCDSCHRSSPCLACAGTEIKSVTVSHEINQHEINQHVVAKIIMDLMEI